MDRLAAHVRLCLLCCCWGLAMSAGLGAAETLRYTGDPAVINDQLHDGGRHHAVGVHEHALFRG